MFFLQASQRRLLNSLNPLFVVVLVYFLIIVRTTMDPLFTPLVHYSDILLPVIVYLGQRRSLPEGLILTLFTSHLYSLCSAAPIGVFTTHYLIIFVIARLISFVIYVTRWFSVMFLMFWLALVSDLILVLTARCFGHEWPLFGDGAWVLFRFFITGFSGYFVYLLMGVIDKITFKVPRISIELAEGEL